MAVCYCCKITLNKSNYSWEHIIPSALGASLKSRRLICRSCNEKAGGLIDKALVNYCRPWIQQFNIQPDRMARKKRKALYIYSDPPEINPDLIKQAAIKICTNFFHWKNSSFQGLTDPVCEQKTLGISPALFNSNPFHILYLYANPADKKILVFLELFGEIGFIIQLSNAYPGKEIRQLSVIDPISNTKQQVVVFDEAKRVGNYLDNLQLS